MRSIEYNLWFAHLQAQRDVSIPIIVILLKHVRHALQANARLYEQIKAHVVVAPAVVRAVQQTHKLGGEAVAKRDEGFCELVVGYAS